MPQTYDKIATTTVSGTSTGTVNLTSIPGTYTDLVCIVNCAYSQTNGISLRFNSDSSSNYSQTRIMSLGTSNITQRNNPTSLINIDSGFSFNGNAGANNLMFNIMSYANTSVGKTYSYRYGTAGAGVALSIGWYNSLSAITSLTFVAGTGIFYAGSMFTIYGIKAA